MPPLTLTKLERNKMMRMDIGFPLRASAVTDSIFHQKRKADDSISHFNIPYKLLHHMAWFLERCEQ